MDTHANHGADFEPEPFGQRGVLPYVWPTFVALCAIGFCTCLFMHSRSLTMWDRLSNRSSSREIIIASVIGRLVIDTVPANRYDTSSSVWTFDTSLFDSIQDGWADSWRKTIGIEWGYESRRLFDGSNYPYWRLRIRWRTLAIVYAIPVVYELSRRAWRRYTERGAPRQVVVTT